MAVGEREGDGDGSSGVRQARVVEARGGGPGRACHADQEEASAHGAGRGQRRWSRTMQTSSRRQATSGSRSLRSINNGEEEKGKERKRNFKKVRPTF